MTRRRAAGCCPLCEVRCFVCGGPIRGNVTLVQVPERLRTPGLLGLLRVYGAGVLGKGVAALHLRRCEPGYRLWLGALRGR